MEEKKRAVASTHRNFGIAGKRSNITKISKLHVLILYI